MVKREDSIRSLGHTVLHLDKPLKAKFKALAESEGLLLIEYLRALADREIRNKQIPLATGQVPGGTGRGYGETLVRAEAIRSLSMVLVDNTKLYQAIHLHLANCLEFQDWSGVADLLARVKLLVAQQESKVEASTQTQLELGLQSA